MIAAQSSELTGLMRDPGDGAGQDQADMGATSFERDQELTVLNSERDKLHQIDRALARIDDGTYGICESCGEPIGKMRLKAFPCHTVHDMQAARGTSLSHADSSPNDTSPFRPALGSGSCCSPSSAALRRRPGHQVAGRRPAHWQAGPELLGDFLVLHLTRNAGAAFSTGTGYTGCLSRLAILAVLVVLWLSRRVRDASGRSRSGCCWPASPATSPTAWSARPECCADTWSTS